MVSVVFFTSIDFRKHAQALTSSPHAHAHAQAHASHLLLCSHTDHCSVKPSLRRNHPHRRTTIAISPVTGTAPIDVDRDHRNQRDCDRDLADLARSRSRSVRLRSRSRRSRSRRTRSRSRSHREIDLSFWVLFEFLGMNDIMFVWELRKCEKM